MNLLNECAVKHSFPAKFIGKIPLESIATDKTGNLAATLLATILGKYVGKSSITTIDDNSLNFFKMPFP